MKTTMLERTHEQQIAFRIRAFPSLWLLAHLGVTSTFLVNAGCGTILTGTRQEIRVAIRPAESEFAMYQFDGTQLVSMRDATDAKIDIPRPKGGRSYLAVAFKEGHCPKYWITETDNNATGFLDFLMMFPTLGLSVVIDGNTGARFDVAPDAFVTSLKPAQECPDAHAN